MQQHVFIELTLLIVLGAAAQWLAWLLRFPSILLLLIFGFVAGPVGGWIQPDRLFGDLLLPLVSFAVAVILFEGGLTLNLREIQGVRSVVARLVSIGVLTTCLLTAAAAHLLIGFEIKLAILLGAILSVTGPTVVLPLLRHIRPTGPAAAVLRWEGIVIDPVGALLAVLAFEVIAGGHQSDAAFRVFLALARMVFIGGGIGLLGAGILALSLRRHWIPDHLHAAVALMLVIATHALGGLVQDEAGLLSVTVMGIALGNQRIADVRHILEFKENLRVFLLSAIFILLSARLSIDEMASLGVKTIVFCGVLILVVRPLSVLVSTVGSRLRWSDRAFLAWMAPRGIVAAAISSVFALAMEQHNDSQARMLVPVVFATIVGTVIVYGLTGAGVARLLGLADQDPQGALIVGAHRFSRQVAFALHSSGFRVLVVDTNRTEAVAAKMSGVPIYSGSILGDDAVEKLDLVGIGRILAMTSNDEVNILAVQRFSRLFGRANVFHLPTKGSEKGKPGVGEQLHGRKLFRDDATYSYLMNLCDRGAQVKTTKLSDVFDYDAFIERHGDGLIPLFVIKEDGTLHVITAGELPRPQSGQTIVTLIFSESA